MNGDITLMSMQIYFMIMNIQLTLNIKNFIYLLDKHCVYITIKR
jgi:hypothetical protein